MYAANIVGCDPAEVGSNPTNPIFIMEKSMSQDENVIIEEHGDEETFYNKLPPLKPLDKTDSEEEYKSDEEFFTNDLDDLDFDDEEDDQFNKDHTL